LSRRITTVYRDRELDGFALKLSKQVGKGITALIAANGGVALRAMLKLSSRT
jgi:hypothetical protein